MPTIETIGVIGAGTMGHSIALDFALHGFDVRLYDIAEEPLARAAAHKAAIGGVAQKGTGAGE